MSIRISPGELPEELRRRMKRTPEVVRRGIRMGANRGMAMLVMRTPVYTGQMKASWKVAPGPKRVPWIIENSAPHAGIIEAGARPHRVSEEGVAALERWARLKLGVNAEEAARIAEAIAWRLRRKGQKPTYFVRNSRPELREALVQEIVRELEAFASRRS